MKSLKEKLEAWADARESDEAREMLELLWPVIEAAEAVDLTRAMPSRYPEDDHEHLDDARELCEKALSTLKSKLDGEK